MSDSSTFGLCRAHDAEDNAKTAANYPKANRTFINTSSSWSLSLLALAFFGMLRRCCPRNASGAGISRAKQPGHNTLRLVARHRAKDHRADDPVTVDEQLCRQPKRVVRVEDGRGGVEPDRVAQVVEV